MDQSATASLIGTKARRLTAFRTLERADRSSPFEVGVAVRDIGTERGLHPGHFRLLIDAESRFRAAHGIKLLADLAGDRA